MSTDFSDEFGYKQALLAAGCEILKFQEFGDYQGEWIALVKYKGRTTWVFGAYGSCSGCDAFQSEFPSVGKELNKRELALFAKQYIDEEQTTEELLRLTLGEWDGEERARWIVDNAPDISDKKIIESLIVKIYEKEKEKEKEKREIEQKLYDMKKQYNDSIRLRNEWHTKYAGLALEYNALLNKVEK